jgi:dipeptidyl aminopeptidase/acylaminoacyl peptidase
VERTYKEEVVKRKFSLEDLSAIAHVSDAQISPDGDKTAFVVSRSKEDGDGYATELWIAEEKNKPYSIVEEMNNLAMPRWNPDGDKILLTASKDGVSQLFLYGLKDNVVKQLTSDGGNKDLPSWSPDGTRIAFVETISSDFKKRKTMEIKQLKHKADAAKGIIDLEEKKRIMVLDVETGESTVVTPDDFCLARPEFSALFNPSWSGDGKRLVFTSKVQDPLDRDQNPRKSNVYIVDSEGGKPESVRRESGAAAKPIWSGDDESIIFVGHLSEFKNATTQRLSRLNIKDGALEYLSKDFDRDIGDITTSDCYMGYSESHPVLSKSGNKVYFNASDHGSVGIYSLDLNTNEVENVIGGERRIFGFTMSRNRKKIAFCYSTVDIPGDIALYDVETGEETRLTEMNGELLNDIDLSIPEEIKTESVDGLEVCGWVMKPIGCIEGEKYPAVLNIHGGPNAQWGWTFSFESQILAASGYGVMYCNPRGSKGYGQDFTAAIHNEFGGLDFEDFMIFTNRAIDCGFIDSDRLAVMGVSYGGFSTNWIVSHTDRFKVAMSQAGISNWMTEFTLSDYGYSCMTELLGWDGIDDMLDLWKISPLAYAKDIKTPMLFIHGVKDMRCPIDQGEQLYMYLKSLGRECEMVRFPEGNHALEMIDGADPGKRRNEYILEYFRRYI